MVAQVVVKPDLGRQEVVQGGLFLMPMGASMAEVALEGGRILEKYIDHMRRYNKWEPMEFLGLEAVGPPPNGATKHYIFPVGNSDITFFQEQNLGRDHSLMIWRLKVRFHGPAIRQEFFNGDFKSYNPRWFLPALLSDS